MRPRSWWRDLPWAPWSIVVWIASLGWMAGLVLLSLPLRLFWPFERYQPWFPQPQTAWVLFFSFSRLKVLYHPGFDRRRVSVFVQNHVSMLDGPVATGAIPQPICGLENVSHLRIPGYGWLMRLANAIPVGKVRASQFGSIAQAFRERASRGISILAFPEAHRTLDGRLRPFKAGVFRIARDAGLPIVPVAVRGTFAALPKGTFVIRPTRITAYVGPQLETAGLDDDELDRRIEEVRDFIRAYVERGENPEAFLEGPGGSKGRADAPQPFSASG